MRAGIYNISTVLHVKLYYVCKFSGSVGISYTQIFSCLHYLSVTFDRFSELEGIRDMFCNYNLGQNVLDTLVEKASPAPPSNVALFFVEFLDLLNNIDVGEGVTKVYLAKVFV